MDVVVVVVTTVVVVMGASEKVVEMGCRGCLDAEAEVDEERRADEALEGWRS